MKKLLSALLVTTFAATGASAQEASSGTAPTQLTAAPSKAPGLSNFDQAIERWTLTTSALIYYGKCKSTLDKLTPQEEKNLVENALFSKALASATLQSPTVGANKKSSAMLLDNGSLGIRDTVQEKVKKSGCKDVAFKSMRDHIPEVSKLSIREKITASGKAKPPTMTDAQVKTMLDSLK